MAWDVRTDREVGQLRPVVEGLLVGALLTGAVLVTAVLAGIYVLGGPDAV